MSAPALPPLARSYLVEPGFLAGPWPGSPDPEGARALAEALAGTGVVRVLALVGEDEAAEAEARLGAYEVPLREALAREGRSLALERHPVPDFGVPEPGAMRAILDAIAAALTRGETLYLHCWGGKGRTGTVVACWLAERRGLGGEEALAALDALRAGLPPGSGPSPENEAQRDFVRAWA